MRVLRTFRVVTSSTPQIIVSLGYGSPLHPNATRKLIVSVRRRGGSSGTSVPSARVALLDFRRYQLSQLPCSSLRFQS